MSQKKLWAGLACVGLLAACGDDNEPSNPDVADDTTADTSDAGVDTAPDVGDDTGEDTTPDTTDTTPDTPDTPDAAVEICDDETDNDDDGDVDCDDADCDDDAACAWPYDFPEPACEVDEECGDEQACVGGACRDALDDPLDFAYDSVGVVSDVWVPAPEDDCCFDLDGDGSTDNRFADLAALWDGGEDDSIDDRIYAFMLAGYADGLISLQGSGTDATIGLFAGSNDIDLNGHPDETLPDRYDSVSDFNVFPYLLGNYGPTVQLAGEVDGDTFTSTWANFETVFPPLDVCTFRFHEEANWFDFPSGVRCLTELPLPLSVHRLRAELVFDGANSDGLATVDTTEGEDVRGGLALGGYVGMDAVATALSRTYADICACIPGMDGDFITVVEDDDSVGLACAFTPSETDITDNCSPSQRACLGVPDLCDTISLELVGNIPDFDADDNGVNESISFGLRVAVSPAAITEAVSVPPREICFGGVDEDGDSLTDCDDPYCWDDVNCGADGHSEDCNDGLDNTNNNGLIDCEDPACSDNLACVPDGSGEGSGEGSGDAI